VEGHLTVEISDYTHNPGGEIWALRCSAALESRKIA